MHGEHTLNTTEAKVGRLFERMSPNAHNRPSVLADLAREFESFEEFSARKAGVTNCGF